MGRPKRIRIFINALKDKASLLKATLSTNRHTSSIKIAVLRSTSHDSTATPSEDRVSAVLALGYASRPTACSCIEALMDRLHRTSSGSVSLKCLFTIHNIVMRGSFILRDQLSFYPFYGGRNFLNLSMFRDDSDSVLWELSFWVRWYAGVVEQSIMVSRELGYHLSDFSSGGIKDKGGSLSTLLRSKLLGEIDVLVGFAEKICESPESLHLQKNDLVYEVVRLVVENYRLVQREILVRVKELGERIEGLSPDELTQSLRIIDRFEECKIGLSVLFVNRGMNGGLWDLVKQTRRKLVEVKEKREEKRLVVVKKRVDSTELTRYWNPFVEPSQMVRVPSSEGLLICWG